MDNDIDTDDSDDSDDDSDSDDSDSSGDFTRVVHPGTIPKRKRIPDPEEDNHLVSPP